MKKRLTLAQKMRWIAGVLYVVLAVYELFITRGNVLYYSFINGTFINVLALLAFPMAGAMAVWMFASKKVLGAGARRGVVIGTLLVVVYLLMTYSAQTTIIEYSMAWTFPSVFNNPAVDVTIWMYFFMIFRLLLLILAAFFVTSSKQELDADAKDAEPEKLNVHTRPPEEKAQSRAAKPEKAEKGLDEPLDVKKAEKDKK